MIVRSNIITRQDLFYAARSVEDVIVDYQHEGRGRDGRTFFYVYLEGLGARHKRARNQRDGMAATWDDHGLWMAELFAIDPEAHIAGYKGVEDFKSQTADAVLHAYGHRNYKAPWLDASDRAEAAQREIDRREKLNPVYADYCERTVPLVELEKLVLSA